MRTEVPTEPGVSGTIPGLNDVDSPVAKVGMVAVRDGPAVSPKLLMVIVVTIELPATTLPLGGAVDTTKSPVTETVRITE